jgi:hypothetical protein
MAISWSMVLGLLSTVIPPAVFLFLRYNSCPMVEFTGLRDRLRRALTFPFDDPLWFRKMLVAGWIGVIPVVGPIAQWGWGVEICRRVIRGETAALPDMRFAAHLKEGARWLGVLLGWWTPALVLAILSVLGAFLSGLLPPASAAAAVTEALGAVFGGLAFLYMIILPAIHAAAAGEYAGTADVRQALRLRKIAARLRAEPAGFALFIPGVMLLALLSLSGGLIFCIGMPVTLAYFQASGFFLAGKVHASIAPDHREKSAAQGAAVTENRAGIGRG